MILHVTFGNILQLYMTIPIFLSHTYAYEFSMFKRHFNDSIRLSRPYQTLQKLSLMSCCVLCHYDKRCNGVNYQEASQICQLNDQNIFHDVFKPETDGAWVVYTTMAAAAVGDVCETDTDCPFINSKCITTKRGKLPRTCVCNDKFKFDEEKHTCVQECESFGATFTLYTGKAIDMNSKDATITTRSVEECRDFCLSLGDRCRSFVMFSSKTKNRGCHVKTLTMQQAIDGGLLTESKGANLYDRDCE